VTHKFGGATLNPYENLANAIILQAVKDYRLTDDEQELQEIERFFPLRLVRCPVKSRSGIPH
jgi:hypothetical protein